MFVKHVQVVGFFIYSLSFVAGNYSIEVKGDSKLFIFIVQDSFARQYISSWEVILDCRFHLILIRAQIQYRIN